MNKARPTGPCPVPGCANRIWASRNLPVCSDCACTIATIMHRPEQQRSTQLELEAMTLRATIRRQTQELRELRTPSDATHRTDQDRAVEGVIYYLRVGAYIKVGWTSDLEKRMRAYSPDSVLLATEPGTRKDEAKRHRLLAVHRTHGREWYAMTPSVMHHIEQVAAEHGTPDPVSFAAQPVAIPQPRTVQPVKVRGWSGRAAVGT